MSRFELQRRRFLLLWCACSAVAWGITHPGQAIAQSELRSEDLLLQKGEVVYRNHCATCHGPDGEGVDGSYDNPLAGDLSVGELADLIGETMPEGEPEVCTGPDAQAVAAFIHHAFYSEAARIRNRPPRVTLARLTGNQLRQSLADLYARFAGIADVDEKRGVRGKYFDSRRRRKDNLKVDRTDLQIDFDFGNEPPVEGLKAKEFAVDWEGGLLADKTGRYEIIVRSTCSFVFDFGRDGRELINNHVQSGDKTEFRRTLTLTAGRIYPFEIRFVQRERKTKQPPAKISLSWIPPGGTEEVIPSRNLTPAWAPATFSLQTDLPPDDRSYGYERGIGIDRSWDDSTTMAALEFAAIVNDELWPDYYRRNRNRSKDKRELLQRFLIELAETAFRQPLSEELRKLYVSRQLEQTVDDAEAIKRVVLVTLKSPRFLYPTSAKNQSPSSWSANQLALTLFDSLPSDRWLIDAVAKNRLSKENELRAAARRMVNDHRARGKTRQMLHAWLGTDHFDEITKDADQFPGFSAEVVSELRKSFDASLDEIVWGESSDYRQLFNSEWTFTSDKLSEFYGPSWQPAESSGTGLRRSVADTETRFGILTHPLLMSGLAYHDSTSPIHRGVFLIRKVLGRTLQPPQAAFTPFSPDLHPQLSTRERVALQTGEKNCQVCHQRINSLGFALENFDAVGRFRTKERDRVVDASGGYRDRKGDEVQFAGPRELAAYLANSEEAQRAFITAAFQYFVKQPPGAFGDATVDRLAEQFARNDYSIRELLVEIAVIAASRQQTETQ